MARRLRDDVILEKVSGIHLLVSLRTAWGESPFAIQIAAVSAEIWKLMKEGKDDETIISFLTGTRGYSQKKAEEILTNFIRSAERLHYFVPEDQEC